LWTNFVAGVAVQPAGQPGRGQHNADQGLSKHT
jgi:hypothetical protein